MNFNIFDFGNVIYALYFFLLILLVIFRHNYSNYENKKIFILLILIQLFLGCFRMEGVGTDTFAYIRFMTYNYSLSYKEVFETFILNDPIFYVILKFIYDPFQSYTLVFSILQIAFWSSFGIIIYKYSDKCLLALLVFVFLKYNFNLWSAIRQGLALSFLLWSYSFLIKEKNKTFLLFIALASMIHSSAIMFLVAYPLRKISLYNNKGLMVALTILVIVSTQFLEILNAYDPDISLNKDSVSNLFILLTTILAFLFIYSNIRNIEIDSRNNLLFNLSFIAFLMAILGFRITLGYRALIYFGVFISMIVGNIVYQKRWSLNQSVVRLILPMLILYILTGIPASVTPYHFVWEENVYIDPDTKK